MTILNSAQPSTTHESANHIPALDGLRGIAILLVLIFHLVALPFFFFGAVPSRFDAEALKIMSTGWTGVNLFFILSGFLITGILLESKGSAWTYFRNFYARRVLRIFPPYYALLFFLIVVLAFLLPGESETVDFVRGEQFWLWTYLLNIRHYVVPGSLYGPTYLTSHLWSLSVEEQFYLAWPLFVLLLNRKALIGLTIAMVITAFVLRIVLFEQGHSTGSLVEFTPARMDDLAIGALIALLVRQPESRRYLAALAWPVAAISSVGLVALFVARDGILVHDSWTLRVGLTMFGTFFGAFFTGVILSQPRGIFRVTLSHQSIRWLGRYSYAIYLIHYPLMNLVLHHSTMYNSVPEVFGSLLPRAIVVGLIVAVLSCLLARLSWLLIETPFLRLRGKFPQPSGTASWWNPAAYATPVGENS